MEDPGPSCEPVKSMYFPTECRDKHSKNSNEDPIKSVYQKSIDEPIFFKKGLTDELSKPEVLDPEPEPNPKFPDQQWSQTQLDAIFKLLEEHIMTFVRDELRRFRRILCIDYPEFLDSEEAEKEQSIREPFLNITLDFLRRMKQESLAERLHNKCLSGVCQTKIKCHLKQRFSHVSEGINMDENRTLLNQIYTELYITEGGAAGVNQEHEVKRIEAFSRKRFTSETTIKCEDIFKGPAHRQGPITAEQTETQSPAKEKVKKKPSLKGMFTKITSGLVSVRTGTTEKQGLNKTDRQPIRTVLTKGVAGIGKTVLTQKFCLDWAEDKANQEIQLLFPFTFRELNVLRDTQFSLVELLHHFFSESKPLCNFEQLQVLFIFDGLDECRLPLDFGRTRVLTDPTESASVDVLLVNLIRGRLLPSARLWITTRPAAANQIPAECVSMVTEVRGFADPQKEQYFRKRFGDEREAVISHIKKSQSLYIMCQIPVFCWILSRVLEYVLKTSEGGELPQTLTQMYIHFLVVQAKVKSLKYDGRCMTDPPWTPENRDMVLSLGKLAFEQLQKGNLIFYESDLRDSGIDLTVASVYSGVFTQVFKEELGLYQDKVYCFIHLSVQEFLAALHVHHTFFTSGQNLLSTPLSSESPESEVAFYCSAVDRALESPNGHLDLFLRFLLGLSLKTNQHLLPGLLPPTGNSSQRNVKTIEYIKKRIGEGLSTERSINLFHCLNELNDHTLVEQIQQTITEGGFSNLSPAQWSALVFILLSSDSSEVFDLKRYSATPDTFLKLLSVIKASNKAILSSCFLSSSCCGPLSSVLCSDSSSLTHLDLSDNDLQDSGVEQLCTGLKSALCRLETLSLSGCVLSSTCCGPLSLVLSSESSSLTHLDLSANDLKDSGVELLCCGLKNTHCKLKTLSLNACKLSQSSCGPLSSVLKSESSSLTHLNLSYNNLKDSGVELLCSGLKSAPCRLETLRLSFCNLSQGSCGALSTVLSSSSLTLLDLSDNYLKDSGVELLCSGLKSATCRLENLRLSGCAVSEKGGAALASALNSAHSHLKELDLSYNHPGPSTRLLTHLRLDSHLPLETVWLNPSGGQWLTPGLRKYFLELSLDLNTAHRALQLSEDKRTITHVDEEQPYPEHPDRFDSRPQVLTSTTLTQRSYWEVQWEGCDKDQPGWVDITVCHKTLKRKGNSKESQFGLNNESWTLSVFKGRYSFRHNGREFPIVFASSRRVAVYLDPKAGFLAFYEVKPDGSQAILHCLNTTFKEILEAGHTVIEPLVAGFGSYRSSISLM